jgi:hypothetical protein
MATDNIRVLSFVDGRTEVWAAGVTYLRSKEFMRRFAALPWGRNWALSFAGRLRSAVVWWLA